MDRYCIIYYRYYNLHIINFVQMFHILENYSLAIVKLIGALQLFGSIITVWF